MRGLVSLLIKTSRLSYSTLIFETRFASNLSFKSCNRNQKSFEIGKPVTNFLINFFRKNSQMMQSKEVEVPMPWGNIKAQIFGDSLSKNATPMLAIHGYLDNSNSFKPLAPYLCNGEYYIISIDLPGHGLSSKLPNGIPYTPKLFLSSVRRIVKYFDLKNFIMLSHSYGTIIALLYDTVFQNELKAILAIDWVFGNSSRKWLDNSTYWKEGIDAYIEFEHNSKNESAQINNRKKLTPELATKILQKANRHLDEASAKLLIERALIIDEQGEYKFSRDLYVKLTMSLRDHYIDVVEMRSDIAKYLTAPAIIIHANPPSYGQQAMDDTMKTINMINDGSRTKIELVNFEGSHHFHMM